jgi:hypothetical protein
VNKKIGGIPIWIVAIVVAGGGYLFYRIHKEREEEPTGEGLYPTTGLERPEREENTAAAPAAGIAQLGEELGALASAGFVPAGSQEAQKEPAFAPPNKLESILEEGFGSYLEGLINPQAREAPVGAGNKGKKAGKAAGANKGHHPGHTAKPNHGAATHPKQRIGLGKSKAVGTGGSPKSGKAQKATSHVGQPAGGAHAPAYRPPKPPKVKKQKAPKPKKQKAHH